MIGTYAFSVQRNLIGQVRGHARWAGGSDRYVPAVAAIGHARPHSYEIFSLVDRLGISQSSVVGWGVRLWPVVPFLLVLAVTLQWFPRKWIGGTAVLIAVVYAGVVSYAVRSASSNSLITIESGPLVTLVGVVVLAAGALTATLTRCPNSSRPAAPTSPPESSVTKLDVP